jgi:hypothetical protein
MTEKVNPGAQKPEMSREQLVRANFEAYGDLVWAQNEPKFREEYHLDPEAMRRYREAWNAHSEKRDWEWWQRRVANQPDTELKAEIAECMAEIKAIERRLPARHQATTDGQTFHDILNRAGDGERITPEPALTPTKEREM